MNVKDKNLALEGLRGIASLTVVIGHFTFVFFPYLATMFQPVPGAVPAFWFETWAQYPPFTLLFSAEAAVCVFFVMSGYVLTTKFFATGSVEDLQTAAAKRYARLALPTAASILIAWFLWRVRAIYTADGIEIGVAGWVPSWYQTKFSLGGALLNGLVGAPLFGQTVLNPPSWTIQVELIGSILLFSMTALFGKRPLQFLGWSLFFSDILGYLLPNALFYIAFFAGACLNLARNWLRSKQTVSMALFVVGVVGVAYNLSPAFGFMRTIPLPNLQPLGPDFGSNPRLFWNCLGAIALVAGVLGSRSIDRVLAGRLPVYLGKISFSMYLIHMPILMSLALGLARTGKAHGIGYGWSASIAVVTYLGVVILAAELFHRLVDAPAMKLASRLARRARSGELSRKPDPGVAPSPRDFMPAAAVVEAVGRAEGG